MGDWPAGNNYVGNEGNWLCDACEQYPRTIAPGGLAPRSVLQPELHPAGQPDGWTEQHGIHERKKARASDRYDPLRDLFVIGDAMSIDDTFQQCSIAEPVQWDGLGDLQPDGRGLVRRRHDVYHLQPRVGGPNTLSCASMGGMMMGGPMAMVNMSVQIPPSSQHPGGVNLLMGDGSVRFIKSTVALSIWRALGTRNGGEVTSSSDY